MVTLGQRSGPKRCHKQERERERERGSAPCDGAEINPSSGMGKKSNCNLDRFLESTCPSVRPQYLPKSCEWDCCPNKQEREVEPLPYFILGDLWEFFGEWSAYGAGVPITLSGQDTVVQYYVPYLSALQLYTPSGKRPLVKIRRPGDESDGNESDFRDSGSEASESSENDRVPDCCNCNCGEIGRNECMLFCQCCKFRESCEDSSVNGTISLDSESIQHRNKRWCDDLLFQYFEASPPYARVPLTDKIADLSRGFPELRYLRSADLLPASWMAIAWYPIYRIPTGPTLHDLEACFLTFHCLSTSLQDGAPSGIVEPMSPPFSCSISALHEGSRAQVIKLQAFGLAHYKLRGSIWTSTGNPERRHAASLFKCAEAWLRHLDAQHPDFDFFKTH